MGRDRQPCRSALSAPHCHGGAEVLALRRKRRAPAPLWRRAAEAKDRGTPDCRHEWIEFLGGICGSIPEYASGVSGARTIQRAENRSRLRLSDAAGTKKLRRYFVGGSPFAAAGDDREHRSPRRNNPHI